MAVRDWHVQRALESFRQLVDTLNDLTEEEVLHCIELETSTLRRATIIEKLIDRAAVLRKTSYKEELKLKYSSFITT